MKTQRRSVLKKLLASVAGVAGFGAAAKAMESTSVSEKQAGDIVYDQQVPRFSQYIVHNGLVYISGQGYHEQGDIKVHTDHVLKDLEDRLKKAGSSMDKVLKVNVYLDDIADYDAMNEVYTGRFGSKPPVRTTVAIAKG